MNVCVGIPLCMCIVHAAFVCAQDISAERGKNVTFQYQSQQSDSSVFYWYYGPKVDNEYVAVLAFGTH